jgi:hypothetical protein
MKKKSTVLKKAMLMLTCLIGFLGLTFAQTTYIFSNYDSGEQYAVDEEHVLDDDVTLYTTNCYFTTELRVYANTGFFYSNALPYYIDSLAFNMKGNNSSSVASIYGSTDGDDWVLLGTIPTTSSYANLGISFGDNDYQYFKFALTSGNPQIRIINMTIYYKPYGPSGTAAQAPTFSHSSGTYTAPISVTLASSTENASIYYTLDGTTPTTTSTLYTSPIAISQTTTVKAIATAEGLNNSSVATATYTFPYVANIAEFKSQTNTSQLFTITNDVTYVFGQGAYTYVRDASAGLLIYGNNAVTGFNEGDQISNLTGKKTVFNGQIEMTNTVAPDSATSNMGTVTPVVVTMSELLANYSSYDAQLVTIENVTFPDGFSGSNIKFGQGTDSLTLYNRFGIDTVLEAGATTNITGFAAIYSGNVQIYPRYNSDLSSQAPVLLPSLAITAPVNGSNFITLDTLPIGVDIQNFELGTDGYLKVETPLLTTIGLTNPVYLDQTGLNMLLAATLSPLPAGTHTITCSLVDMNQMALNPAVTATTTFTVVAPEQSSPVITAAGEEAEGDNTFYFNAEVTITADEDASIYYTTDGTEPSETSTLYTAPFPVTTTSTIKAIAVKPYYQNSNVSTLEVTITTPTVEAPVFTHGTGTYADSVALIIACATEGAVIRYTMDGSEPTATSTIYSTPITLTATTTVKAKAFKTDWNPSETVSAIYTVVYDPVLTVDATTLNFTSTTLAQTFTVSGAHLDNAITLTCDNTHFTVNPTNISTPNNNTLVTVTFDGTEPATGIITVVSDTLSAQVAMTATAQLPAPVLDPANGVDTLITVTMSCTVAGADIHYTTDGTEPTAASATYNAPVALNIPGTYTVKAIAVKEGWENSEVTTGTYIINEPPTPQPLDTVIYAVGFEAEEGFVATDVYNNTDIAYSGPAGQQWGTFYGTPSTTSPITGSQSMHMRWYTSAVSNVGYTFTNFDLHNVTHVTFLAKNSNGLNVRVSHSIDGGITYSIGEVFSVGSTAQAFDYVVDENGSNDFVRLKFSIELPETNPSSTSRLYLDSVVVYGIPGLAPSMASIPTITPNSGFFYDPQTVSITCETEDAVIRYTTDGSEPTETSTIYTEPFQVSATTTIKAKAWKTDMAPSFTAFANISFPAQVENIAQFKANASNEPQQIMSDVTFVFRSGRYIFVEDNSAAMLIYDNSNPVITTEYNEGDVIQGGIFGRYTLYNGMIEMVPTHNAAEATGTPVTVTPTVATVANVINDYAYATIYESKLVRINDVVFIDAETFVQNGDTMSIRDRFNTVDLEINAGDQADVIGFVCYSNDRGYHIYPRDNNDINIHPVVVMDTVATPVIVVNHNNGSYSMHISCATDGATIHYTLDGSTPDENDEVFTADLQLPVNQLTLKAIAVKDGMVNSAIAVYNYNPTGIEQFELRDRLNLYPNPADNYVMIGAKDGGVTIEKVELYNMFGQLLRSVEVNGTAAELSVSSLATGSYIAKVFTDKGVTTLSMIRK